MSIYGMMRTSISGMEAQADRLSTVSDNIANSSTTGYRRASTEFSSLILEQAGSRYNSGSVETTVRYDISGQGGFDYTTSATDLAISGDGFFVVEGSAGEVLLTRAGSFVVDGQGDFVNAAGFALMGVELAGGDGVLAANGAAGVERINIGSLSLQANPSRSGSLFVNFPADADVVAAANLPSANTVDSRFTAVSSLVTYGNLGREVTLDVFSAKSSEGIWEVAVYDRADAGAAGGFPYASGPLSIATYEFDPATGQFDAASPNSIDIPVPDGETLQLDMSQSSQLSTGYVVRGAANVDGNAASAVESVAVGSDGLVYAVFENGDRVATHRIPLAQVASPDNLRPLSGNVFVQGVDSGAIQLRTAGQDGLGTIASGALEQSTVDIASELTSMIETQRNYTANSKVFQTGAELTEVLVNLVR